MKQRLSVCTTEVFPEGQGTLGGNERRIAAAGQVIDAHGKFGAQLFAFPAGFLRARNEQEVTQVALPIIRHAQSAGVALLIGVDTEPLRQLPAARVREHSLPSFMVAWSPDMKLIVSWRQRCRTRHDRLEEKWHGAALIPVAGHVVAPLIGGEVFNAGIRAELGVRRPDLVVLCAHFSAGSRHWSGQDALRAGGLCSVRSVHSSDAVTQCLYAPPGYRLANVSSAEAGISCFTYSISDYDRGLAAA